MPAPGACSQFHISVYFAQRDHNGEKENWKQFPWQMRSLHFRAVSLKLKQLLAARQSQNEQGKSLQSP